MSDEQAAASEVSDPQQDAAQEGDAQRVDPQPVDAQPVDAQGVDAERVEARPVGGRLAMLTGASLAAGAIPLPILPDRVITHIRGAVAHETAARHGLSLSTDARKALARPNAKDRMRALLRKGVELITRRLLRRVGPLAPLSTVATSFEVYALGHLMDRYFAEVRRPGSVRVMEAEAERLRVAIDESVLSAFYPNTQPSTLLLGESPEDLRDEFTRWIDTLLVGAASLPNYLQRRLDAAFDDVVRRSPELRDN